MITITGAILKSIFPAISQNAMEVFPTHLNNFMPKYEINTRLRIAAFLAQIAHESGQFKYLREIWGNTKWQQKYENNKDLGNIYPGDGKKFMGRSPLQITGRDNYEKMSLKMFGDLRLLTNPELLATPEYGTQASCIWWKDHGLNERADEGQFKAITKRINPALLGYAERSAFYNKALDVLPKA